MYTVHTVYAEEDEKKIINKNFIAYVTASKCKSGSNVARTFYKRFSARTS
jgi:hypothetical protein